jgi:hypothetical protein
VTLLCFCSLVSSFGTIFAHTFLTSRSSVNIYLSVSLSIFTCSAMFLTVSQWFVQWYPLFTGLTIKPKWLKA